MNKGLGIVQNTPVRTMPGIPQALALLLCALVAATGAELVIKEAHRGVPTDWQHLGATSDDQSITLSIGLRLQQLDVLESLFWNVSDPRHAAYGEYWSVDAIEVLVKPSAASSFVRFALSATTAPPPALQVVEDRDSYFV